MKNNYSKNLSVLKKCNRIYNVLFWVYLMSCVPPAVLIFIYGIIETISSKEADPFFHIGVIVTMLAYFACGLMCIYRKENKYIIFLIPITLITILFSPVHMVITIISALILPVSHKNYRYLEKQEGFPYFNERFEENKNKLSEYENNNPYQHNLDRYKNSSGKMDEI